ncbi:hypothetical protein [Labrys miyagiensis]|uniref:hypothetical protein n=1 Tax=Labrys miyagiensis TaxID=346912 RepID=UPI0024E0DF1F|nr:hypothetical protein [Labrys miyagiensis]
MVITKHINNILAEGGLPEESNVQKMHNDPQASASFASAVFSPRCASALVPTPFPAGLMKRQGDGGCEAAVKARSWKMQAALSVQAAIAPFRLPRPLTRRARPPVFSAQSVLRFGGIAKNRKDASNQRAGAKKRFY